MRKCKGKYYDSGKIIDFELGYFHQWGCNYEEFESGAGNYSVAIVELPNGKMVTLLVNNIEFLEPTVFDMDKQNWHIVDEEGLPNQDDWGEKEIAIGYFEETYPFRKEYVYRAFYMYEGDWWFCKDVKREHQKLIAWHRVESFEEQT